MKSEEIPPGYCQCGCGRKTTIAKHTAANLGIVKGQPNRFVHGHRRRKPQLPPPSPDPTTGRGYCLCGCGQITPVFPRTNTYRGQIKGQHARFIKGHSGGRLGLFDSRPQKVITSDPVIGELRTAQQLGRSYKGIYQYHPCFECGKCRWVSYAKLSNNKSLRCSGCSTKGFIGKPGWNRGKPVRRLNSQGYVVVSISKEHKFIAMARVKGRLVLEHRLVMAEHLDRCLERKEIVHHKNGIKTDNRIQNLELTTMGQHIIDHSLGYRDGYAKGLKDGAGGCLVNVIQV